jgi:phage-related protein
MNTTIAVSTTSTTPTWATGNRWWKGALIAAMTALCTTAPMEKAEAWDWGREVTQVWNTLENAWHAVVDYGGWIMDRIEQLNQLVELITNNFLTKAIRGFNELMTAIQTDISDVLGTIETLVSAPMDILSDLISIPSTLFSMFQQIPATFKGIYDEAMGIFSMVSEAQTMGKDIGDALKGAGGTYGFYNQISGLNTRLNSNFLQGSEERERKFREWNKGKYGNDTAQLMSTLIDINQESIKYQMMAMEMEAMQRLQGNARDLDIQSQLKARTARTRSATMSYLTGQLR